MFNILELKVSENVQPLPLPTSTQDLFHGVMLFTLLPHLFTVGVLLSTEPQVYLLSHQMNLHVVTL